MTHTYNINGLTCKGCVAKAKSALLTIGDITDAEVQLEAPQATLGMLRHVPVQTLQQALHKAGNYTIQEADGGMHQGHQTAAPTQSWLATYKPILLVFAFILGTTLLIEAARGRFMWMEWMGNFMAGFFLVFSFFKLLNLAGFAQSYSAYDVVARKWRGWGYVYPFVELGFGIAYLLHWAPFFTGTLTLLVMGVSIAGVLQTLFKKRKIQCACLGDVFNLPMSTVTVIEDGLMIGMSIAMIAAIL
ncbi:MAG: cation transporter [Williamsia sp.]|nr:cation transporter [Williamsia sp.]